MERKVKHIQKIDTPNLSALLGIEDEEYLITVSDVEKIEEALGAANSQLGLIEAANATIEQHAEKISLLSHMIAGAKDEREALAEKLAESNEKVTLLNGQLAAFLANGEAIVHGLPKSDEGKAQPTKKKSTKEILNQLQFQN